MKLYSFFILLGISSLLVFEWIRNALLFFLAHRFFILTLLNILMFFTFFWLLEIIFFFYYRWLENHQVDAGLLSENEYTIQRRKDVCAQMIELEKQGYYVVYLDES